MLFLDYITDSGIDEQFEYKNFQKIGSTVIINLTEMPSSETTTCPHCGGKVHIHDYSYLNLKDMPCEIGQTQIIRIHRCRYACQYCGLRFKKDVPFCYPGTRITLRAASWIKGFLKNQLSIKSVSCLTGINWNTIFRIHQGIMQEAIKQRKAELKESNYKPHYLAIDEFAIHKGHTYATCVMDLETEEVIWIGKGRAKADFKKFFETIDLSWLSEVKAVTMDMNASFNLLVEKYLPHAQIVYDRYHMQAQFGKDVLGAVRLETARKHREKAKEIESAITKDMDKETVRGIRRQGKEERKLYSTLKKSRWTLLKNSTRLKTDENNRLNEILEEHKELAVCYTMKEEMCRLFELRDVEKAHDGWIKWFEAASESEIPQLIKFAELKRKRLSGLISHAMHPVSTGKLEGFNNKIKVAKRIGYGYRNDQYFFTLIKYLALPASRKK